MKITWQLTVTLFFAYFSCNNATDIAKQIIPQLPSEG